MTDETITLTPKQFRVIISAIISGVIFIGGVSGSGVLRVGRFTPDDFEKNISIVTDKIQLDIRAAKTDCMDAINELDHRMSLEISAVDDTKPPGLSRQRIMSVERCCERVDPEYERPTWEWR